MAFSFANKNDVFLEGFETIITWRSEVRFRRLFLLCTGTQRVVVIVVMAEEGVLVRSIQLIATATKTSRFTLNTAKGLLLW